VRAFRCVVDPRSSARAARSIPASLRPHVARVSGLDDFLPVGARGARRGPVATSDPGVNVDPTFLYSRYSIPTVSPVGTSQVRVPEPARRARARRALLRGLTLPVCVRARHTYAAQSCAEFEQSYFYQSDLNQFQAQYHTPVSNATIIGGNDPDHGYLGGRPRTACAQLTVRSLRGADEAPLDVEYIATVGYNASTWHADARARSPRATHGRVRAAQGVLPGRLRPYLLGADCAGHAERAVGSLHQLGARSLLQRPQQCVCAPC
jgi:hypothetical protein